MPCPYRTVANFDAILSGAQAAEILNLAVRAAGPAARPPLSVLQIGAQAVNVLFSRFRLFDGDHPANPFVARKGSDVIPFCARGCVGGERGAQIRRHPVNGALSNRYWGHLNLILPRQVGTPAQKKSGAGVNRRARGYVANYFLNVKLELDHDTGGIAEAILGIAVGKIRADA